MAYAQKVKWMKFEDAYAASQKEPRKIFVDIYADRNAWCKALDKDTFSDTGVIRILNEHYYPVKLNSESKKTHTVGDNKFSSLELASTLAMLKPNERLELPTMVIVNERMQLNELIQGFRKPDFLKERLSFFAFNKAPEKAQVKWMKYEDAVAALKKEPRKIFVNIYADWCGWCKVLDRNTFSDAAIAKILNEQYYPVKMNGESKETQTVNGRKMSTADIASNLADLKPGERLSFPTMILLNEQGGSLTRIPGAQRPEFMTPILLFFSENHYLEKSWEVYSKEYADSKKQKK
jgi:thioredoxin-related protein